MAILNRYQQNSIERKRYTVDYTRWLDAGEELVDFAIIVYPLTIDPLITDGAYASPDDMMITTYISGGLPGTTYTVAFVGDTNQGQRKRDEIQVQVT